MLSIKGVQKNGFFCYEIHRGKTSYFLSISLKVILKLNNGGLCNIYKTNCKEKRYKQKKDSNQEIGIMI